MSEKQIPEAFILDIDGVLTDGSFYYSEEGKAMKKFGADDNDALSLLKPYCKILFVTGDKRGFKISERRVLDMKLEIFLVSTIKRIDWIKERFDPAKVVYMGDGIFDHYVMKEVGYGIAPANSDENTKNAADYICKRKGGDRAVAEAALHLLEKFFKPYNPTKLPEDNINDSRDWTI